MSEKLKAVLMVMPFSSTRPKISATIGGAGINNWSVSTGKPDKCLLKANNPRSATMPPQPIAAHRRFTVIPWFDNSQSEIAENIKSTAASVSIIHSAGIWFALRYGVQRTRAIRFKRMIETEKYLGNCDLLLCFGAMPAASLLLELFFWCKFNTS